MPKVIIKTPEEIEILREACQVTAQILTEVGEIIKPGVSTLQIDDFVSQRMQDFGAIPATLNYRGFPKSCCTSINEVVCHGIPAEYDVLKEGDIVNVDITSIKNEFFGDSSRMYFVGGESACTQEVIDLVYDTKKALEVGISAVRDGARLGDIGASIAKFIRSTGKEYGIVKDYTGHGIGRSFHEEPQIIHNAKAGTGLKLKTGMTFTIEPMINLGTHKTRLSADDGWTVRTADNLFSAQWEHTIAVTDDGCDILTAYE